ncbi:MAG: hypothetical protein J1F28_03470 [Oscillospiraceae bacterium]|nr:hypothetical protein [Oscillospiraceae bacterium]
MRHNNFLVLKITAAAVTAAFLLTGCNEARETVNNAVFSDVHSSSEELTESSPSDSYISENSSQSSTTSSSETSSSTTSSSEASSSTTSSSETSLSTTSSSKASSSTASSSKSSSSTSSSETSSSTQSSSKASSSTASSSKASSSTQSSSKASSSTQSSSKFSSSTESSSEISPPASGAEPAATNQIPDPNYVYSVLISFKDKYPEGTSWTNENRRYRSYTIASEYSYYEGGGCAAFAFELSDAAFGDIPRREHYNVYDIRVGDIVRMNNNTHSVIVLEVRSDGVVVAEGNYNSSVHWGRKITYAELQENLTYIWTRYKQ